MLNRFLQKFRETIREDKGHSLNKGCVSRVKIFAVNGKLAVPEGKIRSSFQKVH